MARISTLKLGKEFHSISKLSNGKIYGILQKNVQFLILLMLKRIIPLKYEAGNWLYMVYGPSDYRAE